MKLPANFKRIKIRELAGLVCQQLKKHELEAVLTGGACVSIYSDNEYQSLDLDFVSRAAEFQGKLIKEAMAEIGFRLAPGHYFLRPDCPYIVEFIPPPLSIGREQVRKISTIGTRAGQLRLLSPTDCIKDRLSGFYFWNDLQSLGQAVMVAKRQRVNLNEIKRWSKTEGKLEEFKQFLGRLQISH